MATPNQSSALARPGSIKALTLLLVLQLVELGGGFLRYAFTEQPGLRVFATFVALLALFSIGSVWLQKPWAMWATLVLVSFKLTIDLSSWAAGVNRPLLLLSQAINAAVILLAFGQAGAPNPGVTFSQKVFFFSVLALAAWVGYWGMFVPAQVDMALPFKVPPLHARFLGAMYFSGATAMLLSIIAKSWSEVRIIAPMISIWTGFLGVISMLHLEAFNWARTQVWTWFFAYICFPIIAAWLAWRQRSQTEPTPTRDLSTALRIYLYIQGGVATAFALGLLFAPQAMTAFWPWKITSILAHIYSAPFLSYGFGSLYAAQQRNWNEARIPAYAILAFTVLVLIASYLHAQLFKFGTPSAWLWFGSFGIATLALALFGGIPALRQQRGSARVA